MRSAATAWLGPKWPVRASVSAGIFGRILPLARSARRSPSRSPAMRASIMARPDWVSTFDATDVSMIPASWSTGNREAQVLPRARPASRPHATPAHQDALS